MRARPARTGLHEGPRHSAGALAVSRSRRLSDPAIAHAGNLLADPAARGPAGDGCEAAATLERLERIALLELAQPPAGGAAADPPPDPLQACIGWDLAGT